MKIGLFHIGHVAHEPTTQEVLAKQQRIERLSKGFFGRLFVRFTNPNYALDKLSSLKATEKSHVNEQKRFIKDLLAHPESASNILTLPEQFALYAYSKNAYVGMNGALRDDKSIFAKKDYYLNLNEQATSALKKLAKVQGSQGFTYRGLNGDVPHTTFKEGDVFTEAAFTSTSKDAKVSKSFAHGDAQKPATMLYMFGSAGAAIEKQSATKGEEEVLYPPASQFKVIFSENDHEAQWFNKLGNAVTTKTSHKVVEQLNTPASQGHSGILGALDLASSKKLP